MYRIPSGGHCLFIVDTALEESRQLLDGLRLLKSRLEGSHYKFQPPVLSSDVMTELRLLSTAFTAATLNEQTRSKIHSKVEELFRGQVKRVVFVCLLTCPWFAAAQTEVSAKARNNILYVIYIASDEQFFSLASPHEKELGETIDEVSHESFPNLFSESPSQSMLYHINCMLVLTGSGICSRDTALLLAASERQCSCN